MLEDNCFRATAGDISSTSLVHSSWWLALGENFRFQLMDKHRVLIVDDEASILESLTLLLEKNFEVLTAESGIEALAITEKSSPDIVLLDVMMPKLDGIQTLQKLREQNSTLPVVMLTASSRVRSAVEAMKLGAVEYLSKPFDVEELMRVISTNVGGSALKSVPKDRISNLAPYQIIGESAKIKEVLKQVDLVAASDASVLVTGESGTGKELIARRLHIQSKRSDQPFIAINCAAIPESLVESEMFGHEKGAFTGATNRHIGLFERADGGTIFLDEIADLSLAVQVKLLRVLQEQELCRLGSSSPIALNVRVVTATNQDLAKLVRDKHFRQDLFYRLNVIHLELPPLRKRRQDIPLLVGYFCKKFERAYQRKDLVVAEGAMSILSRYDWPGNIRELENVVESIIALSNNPLITIEELPSKIKKIGSAGIDLNENLNYYKAEWEFQREFIIKALRKTKYSVDQAAELMGISKRILREKITQLGIELE